MLKKQSEVKKIVSEERQRVKIGKEQVKAESKSGLEAAITDENILRLQQAWPGGD